MSLGMSSVVKQDWIKALRSGKYEQSKGSLTNGVGFCCLGVLCDLYSKEHPDAKFNRSNAFLVDGSEESGVLPSLVAEWAHLDESNPTVDIPASAIYSTAPSDSTGTIVVHLSELNDDYDFDFNRLADIIEEHL